MKIKYEFADGTVSEVEVDESIGATTSLTAERSAALPIWMKRPSRCFS